MSPFKSTVQQSLSVSANADVSVCNHRFERNLPGPKLTQAGQKY